MVCPRCHESFAWYETTCPTCAVALVTHLPGQEPQPEMELVSIFRTTDAGAVPLAELALQDKNIEYLVRRGTFGVPIVTGQSPTAFNTPVDPAEIVVRAEDAARARDLVADLEHPADVPVPPPTQEEWSDVGPPPIQLIDGDRGEMFERISEDQLQQLEGALEADATTPNEYFLTADTIDGLDGGPVDARVVEALRAALGGRESMRLQWARATEA